MTSADSAWPPQVVATASALQLIASLQARHGPIVFQQSAGCCEGSAPICQRQDEFQLGPHDRLLGHLGDAPFYISPSLFAYLKASQLIIDAVPGEGGSFSLENGSGWGFLLKSRHFDDEECRQLQAAGRL